jgi:hypothetical protein
MHGVRKDILIFKLGMLRNEEFNNICLGVVLLRRKKVYEIYKWTRKRYA